ncbi:MAG: hypothetical protein GWQ05_12060 [Verrucomicrobiaceae bacterium]|nr:hypothetical protein [Verrucomicrobiaceae bacterium]
MKPNAPVKISVKTSLIFAGVALLMRLLPIPLDGDVFKDLAFWVMLAAYSFLLWATVLKKV